jgi:hypothetical protein
MVTCSRKRLRLVCRIELMRFVFGICYREMRTSGEKTVK